jgi:Fe-S-cluster containining protein
MVKMEHTRFDKTVSAAGSDPRPGSDPKLRCLTVHASYACRSAGACCTAGWAIPVEVPVYERLRGHFNADDRLFRTGGPMPEGVAAMLVLRADGACVFFEPARGRLCRVHREIGPGSLPVACRQFPRVVLHDARGTSISLSHYCPTAADLLLHPPPLAVVEAPSSLALAGDVEGLDARDALPPLLTPGMLTDIEGYDAWERRALDVLSRDVAPGVALHTIAHATARLQEWRPGRSSLQAEVHRQFDVASASEDEEDQGPDDARVRAVLASVPGGLTAPAVYPDFPAAWRSLEPSPIMHRAFRAYLAGRLFGNWIAYHGRGLHTIVEYLRAAHAVLKMEAVREHARASTASDSVPSPWQIAKEAIRSADLLVVHLSDPKTLARALD